MRRIIVLLVLSGLFFPMMNLTQEATAATNPCTGRRFYVHKRLSDDEIRTRVKNLIRCATNLWPVAGGYPKAVSVFTCESGLWPWAYGNGNAGVAQQRLRYWVGRADTYLRSWWFPKHWSYVRTEGWFQARANVLLSVRMAHAVGWSPWSCA